MLKEDAITTVIEERSNGEGHRDIGWYGFRVYGEVPRIVKTDQHPISSHNMDLGNILNWRQHYIALQRPPNPQHHIQKPSPNTFPSHPPTTDKSSRSKPDSPYAANLGRTYSPKKSAKCTSSNNHRSSHGIGLPGFFGTTVVHEGHGVLDGHEAIVGALLLMSARNCAIKAGSYVDEQQPTGRLMHDAGRDEGEGLLRFLDEGLGRVVAVFLGESWEETWGLWVSWLHTLTPDRWASRVLGKRGHSLKGILVIVRLAEPVFVEEVVNTGTLRNRPLQLLGMCVGDAHGIVAPATQAPCDHGLHVEYLLVLHPRENAVPQAIWTAGVFRVRWRVRCTGYLDNDHGPATADELVGPLGVVGAVAIEAGDEENGWDRVLWASGEWRANVDGYGSALDLGFVDMGDMLFRQRIDPVACGCHVGRFLRFPCFVLHRRVHDGKPGDAV